MPGVPPDALAQVKKGLRGLFKNRKQKGQQQNQPESSSTSHAPPSTETAAAAAPVAAPHATEVAKTEESFLPPPPGPPPTSSADPPAPQSPKPGLHIPEPTKIEEANAVNLNPTSAVKPALSAGMSATSGPMGDHMAEVFQDTEPALEGRDTKV